MAQVAAPAKRQTECRAGSHSPGNSYRPMTVWTEPGRSYCLASVVPAAPRRTFACATHIPPAIHKDL